MSNAFKCNCCGELHEGTPTGTLEQITDGYPGPTAELCNGCFKELAQDVVLHE